MLTGRSLVKAGYLSQEHPKRFYNYALLDPLEVATIFSTILNPTVSKPPDASPHRLPAMSEFLFESPGFIDRRLHCYCIPYAMIKKDDGDDSQKFRSKMAIRHRKFPHKNDWFKRPESIDTSISIDRVFGWKAPLWHQAMKGASLRANNAGTPPQVGDQEINQFQCRQFESRVTVNAK